MSKQRLPRVAVIREAPCDRPFESLRHPSRRQFLTGMAALGAGAMIPAGGSLLQTAFGQTGPKTKPRRVDVHNHPGLSSDIATSSGLPGSGARDYFTGAALEWTPAKVLDEMDKGGTDLAILSNPGGGPQAGDVETRRKHVRIYNDYMAKLVHDYPGRFGMFTCLPWPDVDGSLKEVEYGLDVLKADGISLVTSYGNKWLGDPMFAPLFQEINRRKALIYTHPSTNQCCTNLVPAIRDPSIELPTDTTRAIMSMIATGSSSRYPDMHVIFSHAGGTMPFLLPRLIKDSKKVPAGFLAEARRFYYDTAQAANAAPMAALKNTVPVSHIVFGTDFPYISSADTAKGLKDSGVFTDAELLQIDRDNILQLLPKYNV